MVNMQNKESNMSEHGMAHEDVRRRVKRIASMGNHGMIKNHTQAKTLVNSLVNQAERRERGSGAEILKEIQRG